MGKWMAFNANNGGYINLLLASNYIIGTYFTLMTKFTWYGLPNPGFTVTVYS